jgi:4-amino-4-deoxy-L-arabinose transferase-like glycosyltransferase
LFFCLTGVALYDLCRRWLGGWRALLAPVLWLANPGLIAIFVTGKENALYAFLLVFSCEMILRVRERPAQRAWIAGISLGLMSLARVNALVPAFLLLAVLFWQGEGDRVRRARRAAAAAAGAAAVLLPWCAYALAAFGTLFPNSGSAKLIDSAAALAVFIRNSIPSLPAEWVNAFVPASQRAFLARPDLLVLPSRSLAFSYATGLLPDLAYGSWARLFSFLGTLNYKLELILFAAAILAAVGWILIELRAPSPQRRAVAAVVGALFIAAAVNSVGNFLLLPGYLLWGVWYTVPETVVLVILLATLIGLPLEWLGSRSGAGIARGFATALAALIAVCGLVQFARTWALRDYVVAPDETQDQAYQAAEWMNHNLPSGARVGSYSAGLLGYFGATYRVINLDGLANTPAFIGEELVGHVLYDRGLAAVDPLREYLRSERVGFLANVEPASRIARGEYLGLVDAGNGILLFMGYFPIVWGPGEPEQRMIVVQIK